MSCQRTLFWRSFRELANMPLQRMWSPQGQRRKIEAPAWRRPHR